MHVSEHRITSCVAVGPGWVTRQASFLQENLLDKLKGSIFYSIDGFIQSQIDRGYANYAEFVPQIVDIQRSVEWKLPGRRHSRKQQQLLLQQQQQQQQQQKGGSNSNGNKRNRPPALLAGLDWQSVLSNTRQAQSLNAADRIFSRSRLLQVFGHLRHNTFLYWHHLDSSVVSKSSSAKKKKSGGDSPVVRSLTHSVPSLTHWVPA